MKSPSSVGSESIEEMEVGDVTLDCFLKNNENKVGMTAIEDVFDEELWDMDPK
jgi:hypothetical protein